MTETLITELANVRSLKVISRTSAMAYRNSKKPLKEVGRELGVDAVVEGSVLRVNERVRITAQLIQTSTDTHLWGRDFDRDLKDVLTLQRDVAQAIAQELGAAIAPAHPGTADPQAMAIYWKGLYQFNRGALHEAAELAREGIRVDPDLAQAYELLAKALILSADFHQLLYREVVPEARAALQYAVELEPEPERGIAYSWLGWTYFVLEHDWRQSEQLLRRGYELQPSTGTNYAWLLLAQGKPDEAIRTVDRVLLYDPANPYAISDAAHVYHMARRYDDAVRLYRKAQELSPSMYYARAFEPYSLLLAGRTQEAFDRWLWSPDGKGPLGRGSEFRGEYSRGGWPAVWADYVKYFPKDERSPRMDIYALTFLKRREDAIRELEALEKKSDSWLITLTDPLFDPLCKEPRFKALMRRIGYPPSARP
jgi:tetratricopeptide (TPR) repeat protein